MRAERREGQADEVAGVEQERGGDFPRTAAAAQRGDGAGQQRRLTIEVKGLGGGRGRFAGVGEPDRRDLLRPAGERRAGGQQFVEFGGVGGDDQQALPTRDCLKDQFQHCGAAGRTGSGLEQREVGRADRLADERPGGGR